MNINCAIHLRWTMNMLTQGRYLCGVWVNGWVRYTNATSMQVFNWADCLTLDSKFSYSIYIPSCYLRTEK